MVKERVHKAKHSRQENQHTLSGNFPGYPEHSVEEMDHQPNWKNSGHEDDSPWMASVQVAEIIKGFA